MEEFLSIVVLVLWIVISIYNKNRKKKQETVARKPALNAEGDETIIKKPRSILEQILLGEEPELISYNDDDSGEFEFVDNNETEKTYHDNRKRNFDITQSEDYDFNPKQEAEPAGLQKILNNKIPEYDYNEKAIDFDLRQAVIYSEILRRPYSN